MNFKQENEIGINTINVISVTVLKNKNLCLCCISELDIRVYDYFVQLVDIFQGKTLTYLRDTKYNAPIITIKELDNGNLVATVKYINMLLFFNISNLNNIIIDYLEVGVHARSVVQLKNNEIGVAMDNKIIKIYSSDKPYTLRNEIKNPFGIVDWFHYMKSKDILFCNSRFRMWNDLMIYDMTTKQKKVHFAKLECFYKDAIIELNDDKVVVVQSKELNIMNVNTFSIERRIILDGMKFGKKYTFHDKLLRRFFLFGNKVLFLMIRELGEINIEDGTIDSYPYRFNIIAKDMKRISENQFVLYNEDSVKLYSIIG